MSLKNWFGYVSEAWNTTIHDWLMRQNDTWRYRRRNCVKYLMRSSSWCERHRIDEWATHLNMIVLWFRVIPSRNRPMKNWMEAISDIWRAYNVSFHTWESCVLHRLWWDIIIFAESCLKWMMTCALIFVLANCVIIVLPQLDIMTLKPIWTTIRLVAVSPLIRVTLE